MFGCCIANREHPLPSGAGSGGPQQVYPRPESAEPPVAKACGQGGTCRFWNPKAPAICPSLTFALPHHHMQAKETQTYT